MVAGGHFGCHKITFGLISGHFRSTQNFFLNLFQKMAAVGHFGCPKFTLDHISGHFRSIQIFFKIQNGCQWPFRMFENDFQSHFWSFQIDTQLYFFLKFLTKWLTSSILDVRNSLSIAFLAISDRYATLFFFEIFDKMAAGGHFGCPKFTFDRISGHFRSIGRFGFLKFTFDRNSSHFRSMQNFFFRRPFWMSENHFGSHFCPFQIDRPFWMSEIHFRWHFWPYGTLFYFFIFDW